MTFRILNIFWWFLTVKLKSLHRTFPQILKDQVSHSRTSTRKSLTKWSKKLCQHNPPPCLTKILWKNFLIKKKVWHHWKKGLSLRVKNGSWAWFIWRPLLEGVFEICSSNPQLRQIFSPMTFCDVTKFHQCRENLEA